MFQRMTLCLLMAACAAPQLSAQCDDWQSLGTNPLYEDIQRSIWDGSRFVSVTYDVVSRNSMIMASSDAEPHWANYFFPNMVIRDIAFDGTRYVAVGDTGLVMTSTNLKDWETQDPGFTDDIFSVGAGDGFFTMATWFNLYTSSDGVTWTEVDAVNRIHQFRRFGDRLVGVGNWGHVIHSTDGVTWTRGLEHVNRLNSISWNGEIYVAAGIRGTIYTSPDLETWTLRDMGYDADVLATAWSGTHFILATGRNFAVSTDGVIWQPITSGAGSQSTFYALASNGSRVAAQGSGGLVYTSDDTFTWTYRRHLSNLSGSFHTIATMNDITLAASGSIYRTRDGLSWSRIGIGGFGNPLDLATGHGLFLIGDVNGFLATSTDGVAWDIFHTNAEPFRNLAVGNNLLMAIDDNGAVYTRSVNGTVWNQIGTHPAVPNDLIAANGVFMTVGDQGAMYVSSDGVDWESVSLPSANNLHAITDNGDLPGDALVIVGDEEQVLYAPDGVTWTRVHENRDALFDVTWAGGRYLAVGEGSILESFDGETWTEIQSTVDLGGLRAVGWNGFQAFAAGDSGQMFVTDCSDNCDEITVSEHPGDVAVEAGQSATFSVTVSGSASPTYQWLHNGEAVVGATESSYTVPAVTLDDLGEWQCRITNDCSLVISQIAELNLAGPPLFLAQPEGGEICVDHDLVLRIQATGTPPLSYQWSVDGAPIAGAVQDFLMLNDVAVEEAGAYTCNVTNAFGSAISQAADLNVLPRPSIIAQPKSIAVCVGQSAEFSIEISDPGEVTYDWYHDGWIIQSSGSPELIIPAVGNEDTGSYHVVARGTCGSVTSQTVSLSLAATPTIQSSPPEQVYVCQSLPFSLSVTAGFGPLTYQWNKDGVPIPGATEEDYLVTSASPEDYGTYTCTVTSGCIFVTTDPTEVLNVGSVIVLGAPESQTMCSGQELALSAQVNDVTPLGYQWQKDGVDIQGAVSQDLVIPSLTALDSGSYEVLVVGDCGQMISQAVTVQVGSEGEINALMTPESIGQGYDPVTLAVRVWCASPDVVIQWTLEDDGTVLAQNQTFLEVDPPPLETTHYLATITDPEEAEPLVLRATILVPLSEASRDPNDDGCNSMEDLYTVAQDWGSTQSIYDANDDGELNLLDLMYINTQQETCP